MYINCFFRNKENESHFIFGYIILLSNKIIGNRPTNQPPIECAPVKHYFTKADPWIPIKDSTTK